MSPAWQVFETSEAVNATFDEPQHLAAWVVGLLFHEFGRHFGYRDDATIGEADDHAFALAIALAYEKLNHLDLLQLKGRDGRPEIRVNTSRSTQASLRLSHVGDESCADSGVVRTYLRYWETGRPLDTPIKEPMRMMVDLRQAFRKGYASGREIVLHLAWTVHHQTGRPWFENRILPGLGCKVRLEIFDVDGINSLTVDSDEGGRLPSVKFVFDENPPNLSTFACQNLVMSKVKGARYVHCRSSSPYTGEYP